MFCKNCGTKLDDDARFCEKCGTAVVRQKEEKTVTDPPEVRQESTAPEAEPPRENTNTERKSQKTLPLLIGIGVLVIVVGAVCIARSLQGGGGSSRSNVYQQLNANNGAFFAYDDANLYFLANYNEDDEEKSLYSTDYDGNQKTLIADAEDMIRIRVIDGKIYYQESDDGYSIGSMTTTGEEDHTIIEFENIAEQYNVANEQLYYLTDSKIYTCGLSGENNRVLVDDAKTFAMDETTIYYATDNELCSFDLKSEEQVQLCEAESAHNLAVDGKQLYYAISEDGLYRISLSAGAEPEQVIRDDRMGRYVFQGDSIYYIHLMSDSEVENIANYMADSEDDTLIYKFALIGCGSIYRCDKTGGGMSETENDQPFVFMLYTAPDGLYCKTTAFSNFIEEVTFEE